MDTKFDPPAVLRQIINKLPAEGMRVADGKIYPAVSAMSLARTWLAGANEENGAFFKEMCRKIEINKKIFEWYEPNWKKSASSTLLSPSFLQLIAAVLIIYPVEIQDYYGRGQAFKNLNSAFTVLDWISSSEEAQYLDELRGLAEYRLKSL